MNTKILIAVLAVLVLGVGAFFIFGNNDAEAPNNQEQEVAENEMQEDEMMDDEMQEDEMMDDEMQEDEMMDDEMMDDEMMDDEMQEDEMMDETESATVLVTYTSSGYSPSAVTISAGDTVTFQNESSGGMWTASAIHPTHTIYPGSDISKCGSGQVIFDACAATPAGSTWSFTFNERGSWNYHNHIRANHGGTIVVQ